MCYHFLVFAYRGINSKLNFTEKVKNDLIRIIDFLFNKYNISNIVCEIILQRKDRNYPQFLGNQIAINPTAGLGDYHQIDFHFSHELTHAIQYSKGLIELKEYPKEHPIEIEARKNAFETIFHLLGYEDYAKKIGNL